MISKFVIWHKEKIDRVQLYFNLSDYQLLWVAALKGVLIGYFLGKCC
jgi:hypothetical protein